MKRISIIFLLFICNSAIAQERLNASVASLEITTLSTMVTNSGIGEWGYAALVEVDGKKILFDTGGRPNTVLENAEKLGIDLSDVEDVFLSHNHWDHVGGLLSLRKELKKKNPDAFKTIHVGKGIFLERVDSDNKILVIKKELERDGVTFIIYDTHMELFPGVWTTGPVARIHDERNWSGKGRIKTKNGIIEDNIPEDQSIAISTSKGFVLLSGCGHAGIINTMEQIRSEIAEDKIFMAIGGFHLLSASNEHLAWTAEKLNEFGLTQINGAHCTGINSLYILRELLGLDRFNAVVGSVGDHFDLENGIKAGIIAR